MEIGEEGVELLEEGLGTQHYLRKGHCPTKLLEAIELCLQSGHIAVQLKVTAAVALCMGLFTAARAGEPTAFELIKEANRYVGEQAKDKVVQVRSEKSIGTLTPNIWFVVLFDGTATMKATEVKFGAGKMLEVKRPFRLFEPAFGADKQMDRDKLKIDSDVAIKKAMEEPLLKDLKILATQLKLEQANDTALGSGNTGQGIWKVKLWAAKLRNPSKDADIGEVWLSALDGKVVKTDLHIDRVD